MAKKKNPYSVRKVKGTPHHELVLDEAVKFRGKRKKYLFSSAAKARAYWTTNIEPMIKANEK